MPKKILDNDVFVRKNFEKLVKKYARQQIVVCQGMIFTGKNAIERARRKFPKAIPMSLPIPAPEEFTHLL